MALEVPHRDGGGVVKHVAEAHEWVDVAEVFWGVGLCMAWGAHVSFVATRALGWHAQVDL